MKISVIVPVYNVEKYVGRCIESLLSQTHRNLEILLIDDGSKDGSLAVCKEYEKKDERIQVIHKENGGLSSARNAGLSAATGDYVCFIDSDDWVAECFCERLLSACEESGANLAMAKVKKVYSENEAGFEPGESVLLSRQEALHYLDFREAECYVDMIIACNKLYHRSLFEEIRFPEGKLHEDEFVTPAVLLKTDRMAVVEETLYYYFQRQDSITGKDNHNSKKHLDVLEAYEKRCELFLQKGEWEFFATAWRNLMLTMIEYLVSMKKSGQPITSNPLMFRYKENLKKYKKQLPFKYVLKYGLFSLFPGLYGKLFVVRDV